MVRGKYTENDRRFVRIRVGYITRRPPITISIIVIIHVQKEGASPLEVEEEGSPRASSPRTTLVSSPRSKESVDRLFSKFPRLVSVRRSLKRYRPTIYNYKLAHFAQLPFLSQPTDSPSS